MVLAAAAALASSERERAAVLHACGQWQLCAGLLPVLEEALAACTAAGRLWRRAL